MERFQTGALTPDEKTGQGVEGEDGQFTAIIAA